MANNDKDPYALSSDSSDNSDDEACRKPPPKITIEGRTGSDFQRIKELLTAEKNEPVRDEKTLEEIAELKCIKAEELSRFKRDFEAGIVQHVDSDDENGKKMPGTERPTGIDRQTLTAFKDKFEKMDTTLDLNAEERIRCIEKSLEGVGKENLTSMKDMFENQPNKEFVKDVGAEDELLGLLQHRSDAEKRRMRAAFDPAAAAGDVGELKDCCICGKIVYSVEKIIASKKLYHNACFKCVVCSKKLSLTTFNSHKGVLYCRPHMHSVLHPQRAGVELDNEDDNEFVHIEGDDEDDEFAVSSKPKRHAADVVQAGGSSVGDELSALRDQLQNKKQHWQQSVNEAAVTVSTRNPATAAEEIAAGSVRANLDRFISGTTNENEDNAQEEEEKRKQLDAIRSQVNEVKKKWKTGDLEKAETSTDAAKKEELEALKKGPKVRERFNEHADGSIEETNIVKSYDRSELDTSNASEARKSFLEGLAYQNGPVEKMSAGELNNLKFEGLRSFKDKFEKDEAGSSESAQKIKEKCEIDIQLKAIKEALERSTDNMSDMSPEARAERKKKEIEAEFLRYKLARKIQAKRHAEQAANEEESYSKEKPKTNAIDVEIKMAGKAREKFKSIDAQNPGAAPVPKSMMESKLDNGYKKNESIAEIVNKRVIENDESSSEEDNFDVKNLMNKFKNIENISPNKVEKRLDDLEAIRIEAKNLRQRFEQSTDDAEQNEERKRQLEEEFRQLKEERDRAQKELAEEREAAAVEEAENAQKDDVQIVEAHASKMTAKWEKIHKKEAKKAQKSQMPPKLNVGDK